MHEAFDEAAFAARLGYTQAWFDAGVVDASLLRSQHARWQRGDDRNTEHYRTGAFAWFLATNPPHDAASLEDLLALRDGDGHMDMRKDRLHRLLACAALPDALLDTLESHAASMGLSKQWERARLARALARDGLTDAIFAAICERHGALQERVLAHTAASKSMVALLAARGVTRRARNVAAAMLRSRRFRE